MVAKAFIVYSMAFVLNGQARRVQMLVLHLYWSPWSSV